MYLYLNQLYKYLVSRSEWCPKNDVIYQGYVQITVYLVAPKCHHIQTLIWTQVWFQKMLLYAHPQPGAQEGKGFAELSLACQAKWRYPIVFVEEPDNSLLWVCYFALWCSMSRCLKAGFTCLTGSPCLWLSIAKWPNPEGRKICNCCLFIQTCVTLQA